MPLWLLFSLLPALDFILLEFMPRINVPTSSLLHLEEEWSPVVMKRSCCCSVREGYGGNGIMCFCSTNSVQM